MKFTLAARGVAVEAESATLASLTSPLMGAAYTHQPGGVNPVGALLLILPRIQSNASFDAVFSGADNAATCNMIHSFVSISGCS